jgi:hypothetical protein
MALLYYNDPVILGDFEVVRGQISFFFFFFFLGGEGQVKGRSPLRSENIKIPIRLS